MKTILTGSTGFVGSRVLYELQQQGHQVSCIPSDMIRGELAGEQLNALTQFFSELAPDAVIHTAAISNTVYAEQHPEESYIANVKLSEIIARLSKTNACKLISCSSDQVYSTCKGTLPYSEDVIIRPMNVYGQHKLEAEHRISDICPDAVSLRLTWMYDMPAYRMRTNNNFVLALMKSAMTGQAAEYSTSGYRGLTYVRSVAENLPMTFNLPGGVYNYGSENDQNMYDTACAFIHAMGMADRIPELVKRYETNVSWNLCMDCSKIRKHGIHFENTTEGIKKLIADYPGLF